MNETERGRRFGSLTAGEVATLDRHAAACGVSVSHLMEIAGWQVARCAWDMLGQQPAPVAVVAGTGNNGGDGLVAARYLATWGCRVIVQIVGPAESAMRNLANTIAPLQGCGVPVALDVQVEEMGGLDVTIVIDAIAGTGFLGPPRGSLGMAIEALNRYTVLCVDVPSGLDATTGETQGPVVRHPERTCTLAAAKRGLWLAGQSQVGQLVIADIGMPSASWARAGLEAPTSIQGGDLVLVPASAWAQK